MKHIDEGTLQAWFDGELASDKAARVGAHVNACSLCEEAARVLEAENSLVTNALATEFTQPIPTERLRSRIEQAVSVLPQVNTTADKPIGWREAVRDFFSSFSPRSLAYASMAAAVLIIGVFGFAFLKKDIVTPVAVQSPPSEINASAPKPSPEVVAPGSEAVVTLTPPSVTHPKVSSPRKTTIARQGDPIKTQEQKYEQTIASLKATIQKNPPLRPTLQVEYEHSLALIDHAIETTREAAKMNPKDPQAAQFLLAAYQSKVDLMNQIADARSFGK